MLRKSFIAVFFILVLLCAGNISYAEEDIGERYHWMYSDDCVGYFLDTKTLKSGQKEFDYDVWVKVIYTEKGKQRKINTREKDTLSTNGYENLDYSLFHYQIKYSSRQLKHLAVIDYSSNGVPLFSYTVPYYSQTWEPVIPDSIGEMIVEETFNYRITMLGNILENSRNTKESQ